MKMSREILLASIVITLMFLPVDGKGISPSVGLTRHRIEYCSDYFQEDILDPYDHITPIRSYGIAPQFVIYFFTRDKYGYEIPVKGLRLNVSVTSHRDGGSGWPDPSFDIWDDYGFIVYWDNGISDESGLSYAAIGVGDPNITDEDTWTPGGGWIDASRYPISNDNYVWLVSVVSLEFTAKKPSGELTIPGGADFVGRWYWDSGWEYGGFWDGRYYSFYADGWYQNPITGSTSRSSLSYTNTFIESSYITAKSALDIDDSNLLSRKEPQDYNATQTGWCQLKRIDDVNYDWEPFDVFAAMFFDPCDPNGDINLMTYCAPYAYVADMNIPGIGNSYSTSYIMLLKSLDANNNFISKMPIRLHVQSKQGDIARLVSDFILPMEFYSQQGAYNDYWNKIYRCIYAVEGGSLDVSEDDFYGDFDVNGFVNLSDFSLFASHWNTTISDPNYDFGFDQNEDSSIDIYELEEFMEHYLESRITYGDFDDDSDVDLIDFALFAQQWGTLRFSDLARYCTNYLR